MAENNLVSPEIEVDVLQQLPTSSIESIESVESIIIPEKQSNEIDKNTVENLFITSYPPRECGIATYSSDLIKAINTKFGNSFSIKVCALESDNRTYDYPDEVKYTLKTSDKESYKKLSASINNDDKIKIVIIQHEFGFFKKQEIAFQEFLSDVLKPIIVVFHTVLSNPDEKLKTEVRSISAFCESVIVMTNTSSDILINNYGVPEQKISVIAHGTHLVEHLDKNKLKIKYKLNGKKVLTTFGLLSSGKSIETTLDALPAIIKMCPNVVFLIIGKTHPEVILDQGEKYRESLIKKVEDLSIQDHVIFINKYVELNELLEYLQLTDIYLFTTNDPNQAVSGTFAYAMSCACPIISTPIPHAKEVLTEDTGIIFNFGDSDKLSFNVIKILNNDALRKKMSFNALQKIIPASWENSAIKHSLLFEKISGKKLEYDLPVININYLKKMTTDIGIIQFSKINQPDIETGYTVDDNARAMIAMCMYFKLTGDKNCIVEIQKYLNFLRKCQFPDGYFLNYVDKNNNFTLQNNETNLNDANGRAVWALGYLISLSKLLPNKLISDAEIIMNKSILQLGNINSPRSMAFVIKGIYYSNIKTEENKKLLDVFSERLVNFYKKESSKKWDWFEDSLTYANSILPEAMLYSWLYTGKQRYKDIAISTLKFLLSKTFNKEEITVISNKTWLHKNGEIGKFGEQPIDVAYTVMTLSKFYDVFTNDEYYSKMITAFNWFLGKNRLHQIVYNPCTGGCYDGLENINVNLNQGSESAVSYLMARLTMEKYINI